MDDWLAGTEWGALWKQYPDQLNGAFPSISPPNPDRVRKEAEKKNEKIRSQY